MIPNSHKKKYFGLGFKEIEEKNFSLKLEAVSKVVQSLAMVALN
mgnify:CR=1|jgi:hypothetical protein|tara:strand:+ start:364 stop:495 length:132 start_codon:yes stop_codon:yes gene_type:complete